jgi:uncharacterized protein (TIGR00369 family)
MEAPSDDFAPMLNAARDGWCTAMDLRFIRATRDEVVAEWTVGPQHLQAYGIVHGGVHSGVVETLASVGAALDVMPHGRSAVGLENQTSFLHAVRGGTLRAVARPLSRGRRTQVWEVTVADESGRAVAVGRVRMLCLDEGARVAGEDVAIKTAPTE